MYEVPTRRYSKKQSDRALDRLLDDVLDSVDPSWGEDGSGPEREYKEIHLQCNDCGYIDNHKEFPGYTEDNDPLCPKCGMLDISTVK